MNPQDSVAISARSGRRLSSRVARGLSLMAAIVAASALLSAQIDSTEITRENPPAQQLVSTNQLLTPKKAQKATERAREALLGGRYEEAQKQVRRALEICPNCATALTLQGIMDIQERHYADAAHTFQQALDADPTQGVAYLGLGTTYNSLARFKDAQVPLARAAAILPPTWSVYFETARAYLGLGESEAGLREITQAEPIRGVDRQSRSALSYLRAIAHLQLKDYSLAEVDLREAIKRDPQGSCANLAQKKLQQLSTRLTDAR